MLYPDDKEAGFSLSSSVRMEYPPRTAGKQVWSTLCLRPQPPSCPLQGRSRQELKGGAPGADISI